LINPLRGTDWWAEPTRGFVGLPQFNYQPQDFTVGHLLQVQSMTKTFRGVVFHGVRDVRVEDRPFPTAETIADTDAVVRVTSAGINPLSASFTNRKDSVEAIFTVSV
jgi:hypothetical protein